MSTERHPNFNAAKFAADVTSSFYTSLRGAAARSQECPDALLKKILKFVNEMDELVDNHVEKSQSLNLSSEELTLLQLPELRSAEGYYWNGHQEFVLIENLAKNGLILDSLERPGAYVLSDAGKKIVEGL